MKTAVVTLFLHVCQSNLLSILLLCDFTNILKYEISYTCQTIEADLFWTLEIMFSSNFIISAEFCNDLPADVDQINPEKSDHPEGWLHTAGSNHHVLFSQFGIWKDQTFSWYREQNG